MMDERNILSKTLPSEDHPIQKEGEILGHRLQNGILH